MDGSALLLLLSCVDSEENELIFEKQTDRLVRSLREMKATNSSDLFCQSGGGYLNSVLDGQKRATANTHTLKTKTI